MTGSVGRVRVDALGTAATRIEGDELRGILRELLVEVDAFCKANDIVYYLYAGTLLGAIRHGGFIPWDDDIDIMMPREDFVRFCATYPTTGSSYLVSPLTHPSFPYACAKVSREGTCVKEEVDLDPDDSFGVSVDVLPFDCVTDRAPVFRAQVIVAWAVRGLLLLKVVQPSSTRPRAVRVLLAVTRLILAPVSVRLLVRAREKIAMLSRSPHSRSRSMLIASAPWRVDSRVIAPATEIKFEGGIYPAPANSHAFLTAVYGDYSTPPPPGQQVAPHRAVAYRVDRTS